LSTTGPVCNHEVGCITCGDVADEMVVLSLDDAFGTAVCADEHGAESEVFTALLEPPVAAGERVLVHAGTMIARAADPVAV
jgi:hydrogenase maturation factor